MIKEFTDKDNKLILTKEDGKKFVIHSFNGVGENNNLVGSGIIFSITSIIRGKKEIWRNQSFIEEYGNIHVKETSVFFVQGIAIPIGEGLEFKVDQKDGHSFRMVVNYEVEKDIDFKKKNEHMLLREFDKLKEYITTPEGEAEFLKLRARLEKDIDYSSRMDSLLSRVVNKGDDLYKTAKELDLL